MEEKRSPSPREGHCKSNSSSKGRSASRTLCQQAKLTRHSYLTISTSMIQYNRLGTIMSSLYGSSGQDFEVRPDNERTKYSWDLWQELP